MLTPRALVPGDRIAVVAPASTFDRPQFDAGVSELRSLGFDPVFDDTVFSRVRYLAGAPALRAAAIHAAWADPSIAGIIGVRGGWGSAQLLPLLDRRLAREARKVFIGYSDLTSLLTFHTLGCGIVSFHGPMLVGRLGRGEAGYDRASFVRAVSCTEPLGELAPDGLEAFRPGEVSGVLVGGTLTQLLASLGTPFAFDPPDGSILLLEDVAERPYRLDRMITQARQAGWFTRVRAIVLGEMPRCDEPNGELTARDVLADLFADFPGPVVFGFPTGHTAGPAYTLPLGVTCRVVADNRPRIVIEDAAVS